jgi:DNA-binding ferritin-like protein
VIEKLIARVFATRNAAHIAHWKAKGMGSFAKHSALGDFYDAIISQLDEIVEMHQGAFGLIDAVTFPGVTASPSTIVEHIKAEAEWFEENRSEIAQGVYAIENQVDELTGIYLKAYYKLKNLQ